MKLEIDRNNNLVIDYELIEIFCNDDIGLEIYQEIREFTLNDEQNAFFTLKVVMHLVETAEIFDDKPFRTLEYIKSYLSSYIGFKAEYAAQLTDWIVRIINTRDDDQSPGMKLIVKELENADYSNPDDSFNCDLSPIKTDSEFKNRRTEFFGVDYIDLEMFVKGAGIALGAWKSKKKKVQDFLDEYGKEVRDQLMQSHEVIESMNNGDNRVFSSKTKPHYDAVYKRYFELRDPENQDLKRKKACEKLKNELSPEWNPIDYGLNDFENFYQNANNWRTRQNR